MKTHYLIDGNNLIGKISHIAKIHKKSPQSSREVLYNAVMSHFASKKCDVTLYFDGHENISLPRSQVKVDYSRNSSADDHIRSFISKCLSRAHLILVSSDKALGDFAKKCSCKVMLSEEFQSILLHKSDDDIEPLKVSSLSNSNAEFIRLFSDKNKSKGDNRV